MTVNPFWFGVLLTIIFEIVIVIVVALVSSHVHTEEEDKAQEVFDDLLNKALAKYAEECKEDDTNDRK